MSKTRQTTGKTLGIAAILIVVSTSVAAISVSSAAPTRLDDRYGFPSRSMTVDQPSQAEANADSETFDEAAYGVDPIITGPVSASYKKQRRAAGCDQAEWPNVPKVCFPD